MSSTEWKKENTTKITCSILNKTGIPDALKEACEAQGVTRNAYTAEALRQRLAREGYLNRVFPQDSE